MEAIMGIRCFATVLAAALALVFAPATARAQDKLNALATFSILGDFVKNVGGDRVAVTTLVGPNADAHVYSPAPSDAKKVADARVVFTNGLAFESGWMSRLVKASGTKASPVVTTAGIKPRQTAASFDRHGHEHNPDPHAWQSVVNAKVYVANICAALIAADPAGQAAYESNTARYLARLDTLDKDIRAGVESVPKERRRIITSHDAFGYFQDAYGIAFIAPVGVSTESEASARDVARIITQIRQQKIPAVFLENISDPRLIQRIATESGAKIGGKLYSDALTGLDGEAPTYIDMMRFNLKQLVPALLN
jgi:zinc/manganese transport system substrate-binding protein